MQELHKWRLLLREIIEDPQELKRIAAVVRVHPLTVMRWATGESKPRLQNLRQLFLALPEQRDVLLELIAEEFKHISVQTVALLDEVQVEGEQEVPSAFYARVLHDHCILPRPLRFTSLCDPILQQALNQLDAERVGVEITIAQCMPPSQGNKIRSLRESMGRGTPPWKRELEQRTMFLGSESLAGYVLMTGHCHAVQSRAEEQSLFPVHWVEGEESIMAYPITYENNIAGCVLVSSTQPYYFTSARQTLIQYYAEMLVLAFHTEDFYDPTMIDLADMPPSSIQDSYIASFRHRVYEVMRQANQHLHLIQAETQVWQQIEAALLQVSLA